MKEIVTSRDEAEREVERLSHINDRDSCRYFWTTTHVFADGGSFGSDGVETREAYLARLLMELSIAARGSYSRVTNDVAAAPASLQFFNEVVHQVANMLRNREHAIEPTLLDFDERAKRDGIEEWSTLRARLRRP